MRLQPRQQLLDLWQAMLACCYRDETWTWGGRDGANSISDAEQLLCLLYPATEIEAFALDRPDDMAADVRETLAPFGEATRIGGTLVGLIEEFITHHSDGEGNPAFAAGGYLRSADEREPTETQRATGIVDSYSMSLSLCIAALRFLRGFRRFVSGEVRREAKELVPRIEELEHKVRLRLTGAMTGLVRSFAIHTPEPKSKAGQAIVEMLNQNDSAADEIIKEVSRRLERLRVQAANEVKLAQTSETDVADDRRLFECGWTWGISRNADPIDFVELPVAGSQGTAEPRPYLYFTVVAMDGVVDLLSQKIRELDLLDENQRTLADALKLRLELTQKYWSTVARFTPGRWPLEDFPWRTSDGEESDYYSLAVAAMLVQDMLYRESTDDLVRTEEVFDQLARRGRITDRLTAGDPAAKLHYPGVGLRLIGTEDIDDGPRLLWYVPDFATMMLKRCLQSAGLRSDVATRNKLLERAESAMDHLDRRMLRQGPAAGLWDDTTRVLGIAGHTGAGRPSWFVTERVMECFVIAYDIFRQPPLSTKPKIARAVESLEEAEHLLNQERLEVGSDDRSAKRIALDRISQSLDRARQILDDKPATALSLATQALIELDELAYARENATR